jgi:hypothetical protein
MLRNETVWPVILNSTYRSLNALLSWRDPDIKLVGHPLIMWRILPNPTDIVVHNSMKTSRSKYKRVWLKLFKKKTVISIALFRIVQPTLPVSSLKHLYITIPYHLTSFIIRLIFMLRYPNLIFFAQVIVSPTSTRQSHGCSPDVILGHTKHPLDVRGTAAYPHRRAFGGRNNVRRPTQIGAHGRRTDIQVPLRRNKYLFLGSLVIILSQRN